MFLLLFVFFTSCIDENYFDLNPREPFVVLDKLVLKEDGIINYYVAIKQYGYGHKVIKINENLFLYVKIKGRYTVEGFYDVYERVMLEKI